MSKGSSHNYGFIAKKKNLGRNSRHHHIVRFLGFYLTTRLTIQFRNICQMKAQLRLFMAIIKKKKKMLFALGYQILDRERDCQGEDMPCIRYMLVLSHDWWVHFLVGFANYDRGETYTRCRVYFPLPRAFTICIRLDKQVGLVKFKFGLIEYMLKRVKLKWVVERDYTIEMAIVIESFNIPSYTICNNIHFILFKM